MACDNLGLHGLMLHLRNLPQVKQAERGDRMKRRPYGIAMNCVWEGNAYDPEREAVRIMRMEGAGCNEIAEQIGISAEQAAGYCSQLGMTENGIIDFENDIAEEEQLFLFCPVCRKKLYQPLRGRRRRFCCSGCRDSWWNQYRKNRKCTQEKGESIRNAEI